MKYLILFFAVVFFQVPSHAKLFQNSYVSFELPPRWDCHSEGTEWICRSELKPDAQTAIIILTAKEVGPTDSLAQYETYLKSPKTIPGPGGKPIRSELKGIKTRKINDQDWVDGLHLGSEIQTYYTRYLATVKQNIAVLVTFSAHKKFYTKFSNDFFNAILSLRVNAPSKIGTGLAPIRPGSESLGAPIGNAFPSDMITDENGGYPAEQGSISSMKQKIFGLGLILLAIGAYFFIKKKKKSGM
jgi:hypothetical protein